MSKSGLQDYLIITVVNVFLVLVSVKQQYILKKTWNVCIEQSL